MKKSILMLGLAVAAMTSCTNDEVMEVNQNNLIKFESFVNKSTRAVTETTNAGLAQFYVLGGYGTGVYTNVFNNIAFVKDGSTSTWKPSESQNEAEWTANVYRFAAYANQNSSEELSPTFNADGLTFTNYIVDDTKDLVAALSGDIDNEDLDQRNVPLEFNHMLSQVKFTFTNLDDTHKMEVSDILVSNVNNKGTGTLSSGGISWTDLSTANDYTLKYTGTSTKLAPDSLYKPHYQMVIPQTLNTLGEEIQITFTITFYDENNAVVSTEKFENVPLVYDNDTTEGVGNKNFTAWKPGYRYNYTASFPADPKTIRFTVNVTDWVTQDTPANNPTAGDEQMDF